MIRCCILFCLAVWLAACSESDDGPISIYPDDFSVTGNGYVLFAELDSGNRFHAQGDSIRLALDSMWSFGNCFLNRIEIGENFLNDTVLVLNVKLVLGNSEKTDCPQPLFRPDTLLSIPFIESWNAVREIRVEGNSHNEFFTEMEDTSSAAFLTLKDSILVRRGSFRAESISVYLDSSFGKPDTYPRRTSKDSAGVLALVDSMKIDTLLYRFMKSECLDVRDSCETVPDTLWNNVFSLADTALVPVRRVCALDTAADSLIYCLSSKWKNDSTSLSDSVYMWPDTTWYTSFYYAERIPKCSGLNEGDFSAQAKAGRYFTTKHSLFVPDSDEPGCGPAAHSEWIFFKLNPGKEVLDSAFADTLIKAWEKASVGLSEEKK